MGDDVYRYRDGTVVHIGDRVVKTYATRLIDQSDVMIGKVEGAERGFLRVQFQDAADPCLIDPQRLLLTTPGQGSEIPCVKTAIGHPEVP